MAGPRSDGRRCRLVEADHRCHRRCAISRSHRDTDSPALTDLRLFAKLAERLDRWPLLLGLAGAALKHRIGRGDSSKGALRYLHQKLDRQGLLTFDNRNPTERRQALARTIEVSLELLSPGDRQRLVELAIFPEGISVPLDVIATLWNLDEFDAEELVQRFDNYASKLSNGEEPHGSGP